MLFLWCFQSDFGKAIFVRLVFQGELSKPIAMKECDQSPLRRELFLEALLAMYARLSLSTFARDDSFAHFAREIILMQISCAVRLMRFLHKGKQLTQLRAGRLSGKTVCGFAGSARAGRTE